MKTTLLSVAGVIGAGLSYLVGGFDTTVIALLMFMGIDFITGFIVGGVFHKSPKTETGTLESKAGWKGLCKKGVTLFFVFIGTQLDILLEAEYIRDGVCIAFIVNELLSIVENAGLMGIPIPKIITNAIHILKSKSGDENV
jgi:toxin secretion/phage lysis holin